MTQKILDEIAEKQGWDVDSQLALLTEYIENQGSPDAFRDFLLDAASLENQDYSEVAEQA